MQWPGVLAPGTSDHCPPCEGLRICVLHAERVQVKAFGRLPCQPGIDAHALPECADIMVDASSSRFPHLWAAFKIKLG